MLWPIHPQPLPDELLSSWMIRIARDNGFKIHSFYAAHFGRERQIWNRDIDHHAPAWLLDGLEAHTGVQRSQLESMALRAFESMVFERLNETGNTRFLMPLGIFHRTRRAYGQQFCPLCLLADKTPYLRRRWRLALTVVCVEHAVLLQDRCASCGSPLVPHRADMSTRGAFPRYISLKRCGHCHLSLSSTAEPATNEAVFTQQRIDQALDQGFAMIPNQGTVYSHLYFDGLRQLMIGLSALGLLPERRGSFERAGVRDRLRGLQAAMALVDGWPDRFLAFCSQVDGPYAAFTKDANEIPYWLTSVLRRQLLARRAPVCSDEASAIAAAAENIFGHSTTAAMRQISSRSVGKAMPRLHLSEDTADLLLASIDQDVSRCSGMQRVLLLRDKVMFIAARCMRLSIPQLLALDQKQFVGVNCSTFSFWDRIEAPEHAAQMMSWYLRHLRPQLVKTVDTGALFVGLNGAALGQSAVGERFTNAVLQAGLERSISNWRLWIRAPRLGLHRPLSTAPVR